MEPEESRLELGRRVKTLREARGMTLQMLSDRSGLAISTISKVERGLMAPTYDRFAGLAHGLGTDVADLFGSRSDPFRPGTVEVVRIEDVPKQHTDDYTYQSLFEGIPSKAMHPMICWLKPLQQKQLGQMVYHTGEEFLTVLAGVVVVKMDGRPDVTLETGEAIYFDSGRGHLYASAGEDGAQILVVCTHSGDPTDQAG